MKAFICLLVPIVAIGWATSSEASSDHRTGNQLCAGVWTNRQLVSSISSRFRQFRERRTSLPSKRTWRDRHRFDRVSS